MLVLVLMTKRRKKFEVNTVFPLIADNFRRSRKYGVGPQEIVWLNIWCASHYLVINEKASLKDLHAPEK